MIDQGKDGELRLLITERQAFPVNLTWFAGSLRSPSRLNDEGIVRIFADASHVIFRGISREDAQE